MKTLSTPISNEAAAEQSAWIELYDIYLKSSISTPWGSTNIIRLCNCGTTVSFFTPTIAPESSGTQGDAATYNPWAIQREVVKSSSKYSSDKLQITASNVTAEFAELLQDVNWHDTPVLIRKISPNVTSPAATDCVVLFSGLVDSAKITNNTVQLVISNDLVLLNRVLPSENMHANCRFNFGDDMCGIVPWTTENYYAGTVGSSSTASRVKCAGLTKDTGSYGSYGTDLVDALSSGAITASSEQSISTLTVKITKVQVPMYISIFGGDWANLYEGMPVKFITTAPSGFTAGTTYYVRNIYSSFVFSLAASVGGAEISGGVSGVTSYTIESLYGFEAHRVRASVVENYWAFDTDADWGDVDNAYYQIPDAQSGLKNGALKPYIQFDFGSAKTPRLWRVASVPDAAPEQRLRLIEFFSSSDASSWTFEGYFEMPNIGNTLFDALLPNAGTKRYWRICVRSRWGESLYKTMFSEVQAYEGSRHWWQAGQIRFDAATATAALRNVRRSVLESYSGEVVVSDLPATPASGDTFVLKRGCERTFNACAARANTDQYGGFNDMPIQTVIR